MGAASIRRQANALLDEMGLDKRDADGYRLLPDGRLAELIVESAGESTQRDRRPRTGRATTGRKSASSSYPRSTQRDVFRSRGRLPAR